MRYWLKIVAVASCVFSATNGMAEEPATFESARQFLAKHCYECHNAKVRKSGVNLEKLTTEKHFSSEMELLQDIRRMVKEAEMPPPEAKVQPSDPDKKRLLQWIDAFFVRAEGLIEEDPGIVVMPRLHPGEYDAVIRDLTGLPLKMGQFLTPDPPAGEGFVNVGRQQTMSVGQFEAFLAVAKMVTTQARATPSTGIRWSIESQPLKLADADLRETLVTDFAIWHKDRLQAILKRHLDDLQPKTGTRLAAYLEAAWRYRYRKELGAADATYATTAANFEVPLFESSLVKTWLLLTGETEVRQHPVFALRRPDELNKQCELWNQNRIITRFRERWRALPAPPAAKPAEIRAACTQLAADLREWSFNADLLQRPLTFEMPPPPGEGNAAVGLNADGKLQYRLDLRRIKSQSLHLVVGDCLDGNSDDFGIWSGGVVEFADGSKKPWQDVLQFKDSSTGAPVAWGSHPEKQQVGPDAFGVKAPSAVEFALPQGAQVLSFKFTVDAAHARGASMQTTVLESKPQEIGWLTRRRIPGSKLSEAVKKLAIEMTHVGSLVDDAILFIQTRRKAQWPGIPKNILPYLGLATLPPEYQGLGYLFDLTPEEIVQHLTADDLKERQVFLEQLNDAAQPALQDLSRFAAANGMKGLAEGMLPTAEQLAAVPANKKDEAARLVAAAKAELDRHSTAARAQLRAFTDKAWRKTPTDAELDLLLPLYRDERAKGTSYDAASKVALTYILVDPAFLYRAQTTRRNGTPYALSGRELAERLSFALWACAPDEELRKAAAADALQQTDALTKHAKRLLTDPKVRGLATEFAAYWLGLAGFEQAAAPDPMRFPRFTQQLKEALYEEPILFLTDLFQNDRPILNLLDADYTFANNDLAMHYGLTKQPGKAMARVEVPRASRGGLLGMGAFLVKHSNPLRTSPVKRGVWVYEHILGQHVPPPPPNIPLISDDEKNAAGLSIRQQLEVHRKSENCLSCHRRFDALGIALEQYDPVGRWRTRDASGPIDARDKLGNGAELNGMAGLRDYLMSKKDTFAENFCRKLAGYCLGRALIPTDEPLIKTMTGAICANGYRPSAALTVLVSSKQFRFRRDDPALEKDKP